MEIQDKIAGLIAGFIRQELSEPQQQELQDWIEAEDWHREYFEQATKEPFLSALVVDYAKAGDLAPAIRDAAKAKMEGKLLKMHQRRWVKYVYVAAAAVVLFIAGAFLWNRFNKPGKTDVAANKTAPQPKPDLAPGHNGAVLKLANGETIVLDNAANGALATQGSTQVVKQDNGQIVYNAQAGEVQGGGSLQ